LDPAGRQSNHCPPLLPAFRSFRRLLGMEGSQAFPRLPEGGLTFLTCTPEIFQSTVFWKPSSLVLNQISLISCVCRGQYRSIESSEAQKKRRGKPNDRLGSSRLRVTVITTYLVARRQGCVEWLLPYRGIQPSEWKSHLNWSWKDGASSLSTKYGDKYP